VRVTATDAEATARRSQTMSDPRGMTERLPRRGPMPSLEHEAILELFRRAPNLVSEAIRAAFDIHLPEEPGKPVESTLGQLAPTEYHADLVVAFGEIRVIVEVQLRRDPEKRWTWPLYVT